MRALDADFEVHGEDAIKQLRETRPDRYVELAARPTDLPTGPFDDANSLHDLGLRLLKAAGHSEHKITEDMIALALKANDDFIAQLKAIGNAAQSPMQ